MSLKNGFFLLVLFSLPFASHAETIQTCHLEGRIVLTQNTEFACFTAADFTIGPAQIITNGNELVIHALGDIELDRTNGVAIVSFEQNPQVAGNFDAGLITIEANSMGGKLTVHNDGYGNGCGGEVVFRVLTYKDFTRPILSAKSTGECEQGSVQIISQNGKVPLSEFLQKL